MAYTKTTWVTGDKVTSTKLNKIEQGIFDNDAACDELKTALTNTTTVSIPKAAELMQILSTIVPFVTGDINDAGVVNSNALYRVCTNGIVTLPRQIELLIESGYRIYVRLYNDDGTYKSNLGWIQGSVVLSGKVAITIGKIPENTSEVANASVFASKLSYQSIMGDLVNELVQDSSYAFSPTDNMLRFTRASRTVNGVQVEVYPYDKMVISGTGTSNGGRTTKLATMTLPAGDYYYLVVPEGDGGVCPILVSKVSGDEIIRWNSNTFTLSEETDIYFSINVTKDTVFNYAIRIILVNGTTRPDYIPPITAVDYEARNYINHANGSVSAKYNRDTPLSVVSKKGYTWSQGACCVGDKMVGFSAGADDHSTMGYINVSDVFDLVNTTTVRHNLGHACSADYNLLTNTMMIGNGSTDPTILPVMYLVKDAMEWTNSPSDLAYNGNNVMSIDLSSIGGYEMVCCFGENETIAYVMTIDANNVITIFKCLLGLGGNDLTSIYQSDSYGTFITGCADDEYNGTLHVLTSYSGGTDVVGEIQGLKYLNGHIIMPTDEDFQSVLHSFISVLKLDDTTGKIRIVKNLWIPMVGADGVPVRTECEDVFFYHGRGYVMTISSIGGVNVGHTSEFTLALY